MIIGLTGYARVGKDSVAEILIDTFDFQRLAFADALKEAALEANPWVEIPYHGFRRLQYVVDDLGWEAAKGFPDVREFLQHLGGAGRKHIHEAVWLDVVRGEIDYRGPGLYVITDVRYENEAQWVSRAGTLVRVIRPDIGPINGHESEQLQPSLRERNLHNDGTLDDLRNEVVKLVERLR